jgi:CDP-glycerol glycerophosphotransferase
VTDYSSVMFDFALTDKPIVLLVPDLEQYRDVERGFYLDIEAAAPGPLVATTDDVVAALTGPDRHAEARAGLRRRFCPFDDGNASARVVDWLLSRW